MCTHTGMQNTDRVVSITAAERQFAAHFKTGVQIAAPVESEQPVLQTPFPMHEMATGALQMYEEGEGTGAYAVHMHAPIRDSNSIVVNKIVTLPPRRSCWLPYVH